MTGVSSRGETGPNAGERLRERVHAEVVPRLAAALTRARDLADPGRDTLDETYRATLVLVYRLWFLAYAEANGTPPLPSEAGDDADSVHRLARELAERRAFEHRAFDADSTALWDRVERLTRAVHDGDASAGLPAYGGRLLSPTGSPTTDSGTLSAVELTDDAFGPALAALLLESGPDGEAGLDGQPRPVDFEAVDVREFGRCYEELLDADLSLADRPLTTERRDGTERYVPAEEGDDVVVDAGEVYLHGQSGERKAAGAYYTDGPFVDHVLDHSLAPALDDHLDRIDHLRETTGEDAAAAALFEFRVADVAMGTGHFLLEAVDRIERAFDDYLRESPLPGVEAELDRVRERAESAFPDGAAPPDIERRDLLRRQVARRCIYGVDRDDLAVTLARLSLWLHTFVPGLPLTAFEHTVRTGDSLAGVGRLDELAGTLESGAAEMDEDSLSGIHEEIGELGAFVDTAAASSRPAPEIRRLVDSRLAPVRAQFDALTAARAEVEAAADIDTASLHFPLAFPEVFADGGGFDVVVGNPPWEEPVLEADEFWTRYVPGFQGLGQGDQERLKADLRADRPELAAVYERERATQARRRRVLRNGPYPGMGTGDPDTYKAFGWRCWALLGEGGHLGLVLPRSALVAAGSERFRRTMLDDGTVTDVTLLRNRGGWVFDAVAEQYTVALLAVEKTPPGPEATLPLRGPFPDRERYLAGREREPYRFALDRARNWTGTASFPMLPADPRSVAVFERLTEHPPLGRDEAGEWRARPNTELHATNDRTAGDGTPVMTFPDDPPSDYWPVFTGASFTHWTPDTGERFAWADPAVVRDYLQAQRENSYRYAGTRSAFAELPESWVRDPATLPCLSPRIAFRDIARSSDTRTVIPALVPPETLLTNKAPYFLWPRGDERDEAYLLGVMSSIPFDWYARRFVEIGVNYHLLNAIPVPRPGRDSVLRERVVELAGRLAALDDRYREWADAVGVACGPVHEPRRRAHVHELDAVVAHLYGLDREHVAVLFETFHESRAMDERSTCVLEWYDEWEARVVTRERG